MLKKASVLIATCFLGLFVFNTEVKAQEEGGAEDEREEVVVVNSDSSNVEALPDGTMVQPVNDVIKVPSEELPSTRPLILNGNSPKSPNSPEKDEKIKSKDGKSDVSFNILYYLIYKFKHVDVLGD